MGRTSILLVIGFNLMFALRGFRTSSMASSAYDKYNTYYSIEQASLAAESGANMAISNSFFAKTTPFNYTFNSGTGINGTITLLKTAIQSISNDTIGFLLTSTSKDDKSTVITRVTVQGAKFSQFGMFTSSEGGILWQTGDTCFGPYHTQDNINSTGTPRFYGQVTMNGRLVGGTPYFKYPVTPNTNIPLDGNFDDLKAYGAISAGGKFINGLNTYVEFLPNGKVIVRTGSNGWTESGAGTNTDLSGTLVPKCTTYASVAAVAASGVLLVQDAELHVKGVLDGKITLGAVDKTVGSGKSDVYIDSSLVYKAPPPCSYNTGAVSDDMLGIIASNDIVVSQYRNHDGVAKVRNDNVTINASIYSSTSGFGAENYASRGVSGTLRVVGGIQELNRTPVASGVSNGFLKSYDYDLNLQFSSPKAYPTTRFLIQNWVDSTVVADVSFWQGENIMNVVAH
jgi:hypothetical protein